MMAFDSTSIARHINNFSGVSEKSFASGLGNRTGTQAAAGTEAKLFSSPVAVGSIYGAGGGGVGGGGGGGRGVGGGDARYRGTSMSFGSFEEESPLVFALGKFAFTFFWIIGSRFVFFRAGVLFASGNLHLPFLDNQ